MPNRNEKSECKQKVEGVGSKKDKKIILYGLDEGSEN